MKNKAGLRSPALSIWGVIPFEFKLFNAVSHDGRGVSKSSPEIDPSRTGCYSVAILKISLTYFHDV